MLAYPQKISLCGFGGQGIILSAVILGTTAVTKGDLYAVQTQSYGDVYKRQGEGTRMGCTVLQWDWDDSRRYLFLVKIGRAHV